ncbi:hypothetical protein CAC42_5853 [Sphaceloma murrayae]|uniref:PAN-3 domain-containing protein n=1 Tax=Sphaceloma murrayae TaxID=2082308 RepID=A0A2K1QZP2_9PEZI|nr:hypothetical protein CAC42_5853 [Sphaceloma murrayae]
MYETTECAASYYKGIVRDGTVALPTCLPASRSYTDSADQVWKTYIPAQDGEVLVIDSDNTIFTLQGYTFTGCIENCLGFENCIAIQFDAGVCTMKSNAAASSVSTVAGTTGPQAAILTDSHVCITSPPVAIADQSLDYQSSACSCLSLPSPTRTRTTTSYESITVTTVVYRASASSTITHPYTATEYTATTTITRTRTLPPDALRTSSSVFQNGVDNYFYFYTNRNYIGLDSTVMVVPCEPGSPAINFADVGLPSGLLYCQDFHSCINVCHTLNVFKGQGTCSSVTFEAGSRCVLHKFAGTPDTDAACKTLNPLRLWDISALQQPLGGKTYEK